MNALSTTGNSGSSRQAKGTGNVLPPGPCLPVFGYITYWDATGALCASNLFQAPGGNIGIGLGPTNPPSKALDVGGAGANGGVINARKWYDLGYVETRILSVTTNPNIPNPVLFPSSTNLFVGWSAAGPDPNAQNNGALNTFTGYQSGFNQGLGGAGGNANTYNGTYSGWSNKTGVSNTMLGANAGFTNLANYNTCVGSSACQAHKNGDGNTMVGNSAGLFDVNGKVNSFFGDAAGLTNVGDFNTFLGDRAGANNRGNNNTFSGYQSGFVNNANGNSFYGYRSGFSNAAGNQNAFFGNVAGFSNATGGANTFAGNGAGFQHINGNQNTFVGTSAGFNDYHGQGNTFIGASAGQTNNDGTALHVSGNLNTYVGVAAGILTFGSSNTFVGNSAGFSVTTGHHNTFSGQTAGQNNATGSYNTYYGYAAGFSNFIGNSNVYLANPGVSESNTIRIGVHGLTGIGNQEQNRVFFDPILWYPTSSPYPDVVTIDNPSGKLGHAPYPIGGGGVTGNCPSPGAYFLTKWLTSTSVQCSSIYENTGPPIPPFIGPQVGIGTATFIYFPARPPAKLELSYTDATSTYPAVLRLHNIEATAGFTETGIVFDTAVGPAGSHNPDYETARIYAKNDCLNAFNCERLTLAPHNVDILSAINFSVGIMTIAPQATLDVNGNVRVVTLATLVPTQSEEVCRNPLTKILSACPAGPQVTAAQQAVIKAQQEQIQALQLQNAAFQERLSRLESLVTTQMQTTADKPSQATTTASGGLQ